jgi:hypothetical protein
MGRKSGDNNFANYVGFQAFSSDEPTLQINFTNWFLKFEKGLPGFFINVDKIFRQMSFETFKATATHKSKENSMAGYADLVKNYFNQTMEEIERCLTKEKDLTK